jgi:hypothetical protein
VAVDGQIVVVIDLIPVVINSNNNIHKWIIKVNNKL